MVTGREIGPGSDGRHVAHPDRFLARSASGGFAIEADGRPTVQVDPSGTGWSISGIECVKDWTLRRTDAQDGGFVLEAPDGVDEAGRSMPLVGIERSAGPRFLLLGDGRLYRIVRCGPRNDGFELLGWEMPGEYLRARPEPNGWRLQASASCSGLTEISVLLILFAAEVLDAEQPLHPVTP